MGLYDDMTSNFSDSSDELQARIDELSQRDEAGELDDAGRAELNQLRSRMHMGDE